MERQPLSLLKVDLAGFPPPIRASSLPVILAFHDDGPLTLQGLLLGGNEERSKLRMYRVRCFETTHVRSFFYSVKSMSAAPRALDPWQQLDLCIAESHHTWETGYQKMGSQRPLQHGMASCPTRDQLKAFLGPYPDTLEPIQIRPVQLH